MRPRTASTSLLDAALNAAQHEPERVAFHFLEDGHQETDRLSYGELFARASATASALGACCKRGDRVALLFTPDLAFIPALLGTLLAGCVAVPLAPPTAMGQRRRLDAILAHADPTILLTNLPGEVDVPAGVATLNTTDVEASGVASSEPSPLHADELALLQYTSGSTGSPKGVMVTNGNLLANQQQIAQVFDQDERAVVVSWLPVYHDMGLIGGILHPLYLGATGVTMPPDAFMRDPLRWLRTIDAYRGTISPAPDFAYDLCAVRATAADVAKLDLRSWEVACNGSEPVRAATIRRFSSTFAPAGFDTRAFAPSYGLAEATLLVSGTGRGLKPELRDIPSEDGGIQERVSCGPPTMDVAIVHRGRILTDGEEGEIWLRGPSVASGYWRNARETKRTFGARPRGQDDTYLRTGDLGMVIGGQLFITGRLKDLIVVRGRNHHPHDLEATARSVDPRLAAASGAAFSDGERLVLVHGVREPRTAFAAVPDLIRQAIAKEHGVRIDEVILVRSGGIPRTTSGKVRRSECRRKLLAGELPVVLHDGAAPAPAAEIATDQDALAHTVAEVLGVAREEVDDRVAISRLGIDSLRAMQLQQELAERFDLEVPIEALLGEATVSDLTQAATVRDARLTTHPLPESAMTRGQEALWALTQTGHDAVYTITRAVMLPHGIDIDAIEHAVRALVARHSQLRSRFEVRGGLVRRGECSIDEHRWCEVHRVPAAADLDGEVRARAAQGLDLAAGGLFHVTLIVQEARTVLLLRASHLVVDLHALATLLRELVLLYQARALDTSIVLPDAPRFDDAVRREAGFLAASEGFEALEEIVRELEGTESPTWPCVRPREADDRPAATTIELDERTSRRVDELASAEGTTPATVLLTLYGVFLTRLLGGTEIVVGVPTAVRPDATLRDVVGYLVNTVPVRLGSSDASDLPRAIRTTKAAVLQAMRGMRVPLSLIVERRRQREGSAAGSPPRAMFDFLDDPRPGTRGLGALSLDIDGATVQAGSLQFTRFPLPPAPAAADLDVAFTRVGEQFVGRFAWDPHVLGVDDGELLADTLHGLMRSALDDPTAPLGACTLAGERALEFGRPQMSPLDAVGMDELFARQVRTRPDAVALVQGPSSWSYRELAARVAAAEAVMPAPVLGAATPLVGVLGDRDPGFVVALLAAWRCGFGVVPLAPDLPDARLRLMLREAHAQALLALPCHAERASVLVHDAKRPVQLVTLPDVAGDRPLDADVPPEPKQRTASPDRVAYVVFTSGTTGRPKGVPITHANVEPLLAWQIDGLGARPGLRLAQTLSFAFDFGLQEILTTVPFGGTLCFPIEDERHSAEGFAAFLARADVNVLFATPTFLRELTATDVRLHGLDLLVIGGELLTPSVVEHIRTRLRPTCRIINGYGPTEASINCTMQTLPARVEGAEPLSVGQATGLSRVYVLDAMLRPVPPGLIGEVCIAGPGVADGYLNLPEENHERFVPDPFDPDGGTMFKTGDLGRFLTDGSLQIRGRLDDQMKIRGHRIEPREVELALRSLPQVQDAVVLGRGEGAGQHLIAFVRGTDLEPEQLRRALMQHLPAYMIPSRIVSVNDLPSTETGKLDVRRLLQHADETVQPTLPDGPANDVRRVVTSIWRETLGVETIDADANFFELGGHSLAVGAIVSRVCADLGLEAIPYHAIFEHPTVRTFSTHVELLLQGGVVGVVPAPSPLAVKRRVRR